MHGRHIKILDMLQTGKVELQNAARKLNVSEMTIRRDLRLLERQGMLIQVKGGAVPCTGLSLSEKTGPDAFFQLKGALAEKMYDRILPCETLFLGTGTTVLRLATLIARRNVHPMTVITNAISVASVLYRTNCRVILLGGELRTASPDLVGPVAERNLSEYHADWLVTGCDGAVADWGFYTSDVSLSSLEQKSIGIADHAAVLTDSSKFTRKSLTRFATPDEIDLLVTDSGIAPKVLKKLHKFKNLEILLV